MKKLILIITPLLAAASMFAQGKINFANASTTAVYDDKGAKATAGLLNAVLYVGLDDKSLHPFGNPVLNKAGGRIFGGDVDVSSVVPLNTLGFFQVKVFSAKYGSYDEASKVPGALIGESDIISLKPTQAALDLVPSIFGAGKIGQVASHEVPAVPEPSVLALGLLGLGALALRRRK